MRDGMVLVGLHATVSRYDAAMRIVMVASECEPFAKTGGLADVVDALSRALGKRGHDVDVVLPYYRGLRPPDGPLDRRRSACRSAMPAGRALGRRRHGDGGPRRRAGGRLSPAAGGPPLQLRSPRLLRRRPAPTTRTTPPDSRSWRRAALAGIALDGQPVDVLHGHDWEAGPALLGLQATRARGVRRSWPDATGILTCHNLAYHGWIPPERVWQLGDLAEDREPVRT